VNCVRLRATAGRKLLSATSSQARNTDVSNITRRSPRSALSTVHPRPRDDLKAYKAARALLGWHQSDLSAQSNLSIVTIRRLAPVRTGSLGGTDDIYSAIVSASERAGMEFLNHGRAGRAATEREAQAVRPPRADQFGREAN
jgi:hypothetical protein